MTYREYVNAMLGRFGVTQTEIDFLLIEQGLLPDSIVGTEEDRRKIKTAVYYQVPIMIAGLQNVSEGGYSVSWNIEGIKAWFSILAGQLGLEDVLNSTPKVRDRSNLW